MVMGIANLIIRHELIRERATEEEQASPVVAVTPVTVVPAAMPMAITPTMVMAAAPVHLLGRQPINLFAADNGRLHLFVVRHETAFLAQRLRRQRGGGRTCRKCGRTRCHSKCNLQKVSALHDIFLVVLANDAERSLAAAA